MKTIKEIIDEFDKRFYEDERNSVYCRKHNIFATPKEFKSFILTQITELLEGLREEEVPEPKNAGYTRVEGAIYAFASGKNQAIRKFNAELTKILCNQKGH